MKNSTIAAISTGKLPAGIAIIRLSGEDSLTITEKIFKSTKPLREAFSHTVTFGFIMDGEEKIDEVLVTFLKAPNSYTGEDTVEISCHGSLLIQSKILKLLIENGAIPAGPGEFTMRAFMNGKLDLSRAESVMDVISAENDLALKASISNLSGNFSAKVINVRQNLISKVAYIEAALDDPEHMTFDGFVDELLEVINDSFKDINVLIENAALSGKIKMGIDCGIIGGVNVGKSSLLNALCNLDRAIVTDIPGTTRDSISERINMGDFTLNIIDTAGIRNSVDKVETIGIEKSKEILNSSEVILFVLDSSKELSSDDEIILSMVEDKKSVVVLNKSDLPNKLSIPDIKKLTDKPIVSISAKELLGINELKNEIIKICSSEICFSKDMILVNERQLLHLKDAKHSLENVVSAIESGMTEEIFTVDLMDAYESLGKILGLEIGEDVINEVFSKFCIGK